MGGGGGGGGWPIRFPAGTLRKSKNHEEEGRGEGSGRRVQPSSTNLQRRNQEVYRSCARQLTVDHHQRPNWAAMCGYICGRGRHIFTTAQTDSEAPSPEVPPPSTSAVPPPLSFSLRVPRRSSSARRRGWGRREYFSSLRATFPRDIFEIYIYIV